MTLFKDPEQNEISHFNNFANPAGKRVVEIGCGEGRLTWRYASTVNRIVGIDPDHDALRVALIDRPSDLAHKVHFVNSNAEQIPFHKETFDIAILAWSL